MQILRQTAPTWYRYVLVLTALAISVGWPGSARAETLTSVLTYPANLATNADMTLPIQWTSVANVQAYYLYVGSTFGGNDLVNTGETLDTSELALNLPAGQTLYARLWTKAGNIWRFVDSTFTAAPVVRARITYPADGAVAADVSRPIQWTMVPDVLSYYLYVGTASGAKDLVNTGEIQQTSYLAAVPPNQTVYARMWTKVGTVWRYIDSTFSAAPAVRATFTYPSDGAVNMDPVNPIQWTSVANVQAYYLYVGTTLGAKDVVNTGEIQQTSFLAANLPVGQQLFARLNTKVAGIWRHVDTTFTAAAVATLISPADRALDIDQSLPFRWTAVDNAQAYYLYVGTTPGAKDLVDSYEITSTTYLPSKAPWLPAGVTLYARLYTKSSGGWTYRDSTFTASPLTPKFVYPTDGAVGVVTTLPFRWTPPANALAHELRIGTSPGGYDLFKSATVTSPGVLVPALPQTGTLYARALSKVNTVWMFTDIAFTLAPAVPASTMLVPTSGQIGFDTARPFEWASVPLARGYRLTIGRAPGTNDLHDSGEIDVTRRFVPDLPVGHLFGRLDTKIDGQWYSTDFTFSVAANTVSTQFQVDSAFWATHFVRGMAAADNRPYSWTELAAKKYSANCADYAAMLLRVWAEVNGRFSVRRLDLTLNPNSYDAHTLAELFNPDTQTWMVLDPTFDLSVRRAADNGWATAEDVSTATRNQRWGDVSYVFLGPLGDYYARRYAIDYPLLYNNVYHTGDRWVKGVGGPVLPYMQEVPMPPTGSYTWYSVGCSSVQTTILRVNGVDQTIDCSGVDGLSKIFGATTILPTGQTDPSVKLYRPRRYVF
jgi:hypothetical protein